MRENVDQNNSKYGHFLRSEYTLENTVGIIRTRLLDLPSFFSDTFMARVNGNPSSPLRWCTTKILRMLASYLLKRKTNCLTLPVEQIRSQIHIINLQGNL